MTLEEKILKLIYKYPNETFKARQLARRLSLKDELDILALQNILKELVQKNKLTQASRKKYGVYKPPKSTHKIGLFTRLKNGSGIVKLNPPHEGNVLISPNYISTALDDDIVSVAIFPVSLNEAANATEPFLVEGEVVEIVKRSKKPLIGVVDKTKNNLFVIPDDSRIRRNVFIPNGKTLNARSGYKVTFIIEDWKNINQNPEGRIIEIIGKAGEIKTEILSVIQQFNLPLTFPRSVLDEAENISEEIPHHEIMERLDFRNEVCFTIDPEDAKDFDDAISLKEINSSIYELGVHIADVSHYVKKGSKIDQEAFLRGTSVYLANDVIPMLPEVLSNGICSLVPKRDRLAFSVFITITKQGKVVDYKLAKSVINNKRRFTYEEVQEILETGKGDYADILLKMHKLSKTLLKNRLKEGSIDFESTEVKFKFDKHGNPTKIIRKERLDAHRLVEDFMLLANKIVAECSKTPFIYRIHDKPDPEKIKELADFVSQFGYTLEKGDGITSKKLQKLLSSCQGKEEEAVINEIAIRSMAKAIYSVKNIGHFGLGFKRYTHFTSPIRRYPDLVVHRLLTEYLTDSASKKGRETQTALIDEICTQSSIRERLAIEAERTSIKVMQVEYMKRHVGDQFRAVISGVTKFGLFIEIMDLLVEGLVHIRDLEDDYYVFDEKNYTYIGSRTKKRYRLGDKVIVEVVRVSSIDRQIDFRIID